MIELKVYHITLYVCEKITATCDKHAYSQRCRKVRKVQVEFVYHGHHHQDMITLAKTVCLCLLCNALFEL